MKVLVFLSALVCLAWSQQSCADKAEQMLNCMNKLTAMSDFTTILDKKMNAAKTCGATDKNIQCWRTMYKCGIDSKSSAMGSPTFQTAKRDATQCYTTNPNNPLVGLDSLFGGMHHGGKGKGHHGLGGKMGANVNSNMNGNGNGNEETTEDDSEEMDMDKMPADCKPANWMTMMNCTMQALQRDQTVISSAAKLRPQLKQCEDMFTTDCEAGTMPLTHCLKKAEMPLVTLMETNFMSCMKTAGISM